MIPKNTVGIAAEYAVASELARRGIYAQLTLGNQKRTDLLIFADNAAPIRIEVKGKQGRDWPHCKGVSGDHTLLVLVDFRNKAETERPDFYILTADDWLTYVKSVAAEYLHKKITVDAQNIPTWTTEINKYGQAFRGMSIFADSVIDHKEKWCKIVARCGAQEP